MKPFVYRFETDNFRYVYDVITNNIVQVEDVIYDILPEVYDLNIEDIVSKYGRKYPADEIRKAYTQIELQRDKFGMFRPNDLLKMFLPYSEKDIVLKLENSLDQLILNVTEKCNLRCKYCVYSGNYYYERKHSERHMQYSVAERAVKFFLDRCKRLIYGGMSIYNSISFYGGEPLISFDLVKKICEFAKKTPKEEILFSMTTNGTLLSEEKIKYLMGNKFFLLVSLDGPKKINDRYRITRNGKGTFDLVSRNLKMIREKNEKYYKANVHFSIVLAPPFRIKEVIDFFSARNDLIAGNGTIINLMGREDNRYSSLFNLYKKNLEEEFNKAKQRYVDLATQGDKQSCVLNNLKKIFDPFLYRIHMRKLTPIGKEIRANGICVPGTRRLFVSIDGNFYPCERMGESTYLGNIYDGFDYKAIFGLIRSYIDISEEMCLKCWACRICGLCYLSARNGSTLDKKRKAQNCRNALINYSLFLKLYCEILEKNPEFFRYMYDYVPRKLEAEILCQS